MSKSKTTATHKFYTHKISTGVQFQQAKAMLPCLDFCTFTARGTSGDGMHIFRLINSDGVPAMVLKFANSNRRHQFRLAVENQIKERAENSE